MREWPAPNRCTSPSLPIASAHQRLAVSSPSAWVALTRSMSAAASRSHRPRCGHPFRYVLLAIMRLGQNADPQSVAAMRELLGLDRPLYVQYVEWLGNALRGDLGTSYINEQSVTSLVLQTFPATLELAILGMGLALVISTPVGILAALHRGSWIDHVARVVALVGFCMPRYWLAVLLILLLAGSSPARLLRRRRRRPSRQPRQRTILSHRRRWRRWPS